MRPPPSRRAWIALTAAACLLFAAYAASFLYFFVDDEAIPLIYARNLLRGRGFVYTVLEGRVEGYSDFLHVLWSAVLIGITQAAGLSRLAPLLIGKAVSFAAAIGVIVLTAACLRRHGASHAGLAAALGFLALAGPLAVWACSSLETVPFAVLVLAFACALLANAPRAAMLLGIAVVLERIDGIVYIASLALAAWTVEPRLRAAVWSAARIIVLFAAAYHGWRYWYFGSLLSAPIEAKVLSRFAGPARAIVKPIDVPYLLGLARIYTTPIAVAGLVIAAAAAWTSRAARILVIAIVILGVYVQTVGDWMFGWRMTVALFPMIAIVLGMAISRLSPRAAWPLAIGVVTWAALAAARFDAAFMASEEKPLFWGHSRLGEETWLAPYAGLVDAGRRLFHPGDRVAYNQAGLVPYLFDLENIDDLGICSGFVAGLPTTDVYFTGVGRYSPVTADPILRTAHAYLLYQDVQYLIVRSDLLWRANDGPPPDTVLDGYFARLEIDAPGANVIYKRTGKAADAYRRDATLFTENVAHTTRLAYAAIDDHVIAPHAFGPELPLLRERTTTRSFERQLEMDLHFPAFTRVSGLYVGRLVSSRPATLELRVDDEGGRQTLARTIVVPAGPTSIDERFEPVAAASASLIFRAEAEDRLEITDMRLQGQSSALRDYLRRTLRFPP
jgi:hypothetical protein